MKHCAVKTDKTVKWKGGSIYPLVEIEISSVSRPFYTEQQRLIETVGRVEKFNQRYRRARIN